MSVSIPENEKRRDWVTHLYKSYIVPRMNRTPMMHNNSNQVVKILILPIRGERDLEFECDGFAYLPNNAAIRESFQVNNQYIRSLVDSQLFQSLIEVDQKLWNWLK